jgi:hypothetical protein
MYARWTGGARNSTVGRWVTASSPLAPAIDITTTVIENIACRRRAPAHGDVRMTVIVIPRSPVGHRLRRRMFFRELVVSDVGRIHRRIDHHSVGQDLLAKHPDRLQTFVLGFREEHIVYPEASDNRCTAVLILDLDPVSLVRGRPAAGPDADVGAAPLANYVNDRPYVASSFLSVAIAKVLGSALGGRAATRPRPGH